MVLIVAANSAAVSPQIRPDNPRMWLIIAVCISFNVLSFFFAKVTSLAGKFSREKQITLFFASGLRNTNAAMTLAIEYFPPSAALPAVLGIMFQQTTAAIMGRIALGRPGEGKGAK